MKQTAVEWLVEELGEYFPIGIGGIELMTFKAKEMEKQQIIDAASWMPKPFDNIEFLPELAKQYYNETFKKNMKRQKLKPITKTVFSEQQEPVITFRDKNEIIGEFRVINGLLNFEGSVDKSAEVFMNFLEWFVKNPSCESVKVDNWLSPAKKKRYYAIDILREEAKQKKDNFALDFVCWLMDNCELITDKETAENVLWRYESEDYTVEGLFEIFVEEDYNE